MENLYAWIDGVIATADGTSFVAGVIAGLLWNRFAPAIRAFVARTPTKVDDLLIGAADACLGEDVKKGLCAEELDKILPNSEIVKLVKLRKARIESEKKSK
jgi:hypothetical protein